MITITIADNEYSHNKQQTNRIPPPASIKLTSANILAQVNSVQCSMSDDSIVETHSEPHMDAFMKWGATKSNNLHNKSHRRQQRGGQKRRTLEVPSVVWWFSKSFRSQEFFLSFGCSRTVCSRETAIKGTLKTDFARMLRMRQHCTSKEFSVLPPIFTHLLKLLLLWAPASRL